MNKTESNNEYRFYKRTKVEDSNILDSLIGFARQIFCILLNIFEKLRFFLSHIHIVINIVNEQNVKEIKDLIIKIQGLIKKFDGAPGIFVYLERVKHIAREKYKEMLSHDQKVFNKNMK